MIKISHVKTLDDLKCFIAYCSEHIKDCKDTKELEQNWENFNKSIKKITKNMMERL
jgi:hypothetical protein